MSKQLVQAPYSFVIATGYARSYNAQPYSTAQVSASDGDLQRNA